MPMNKIMLGLAVTGVLLCSRAGAVPINGEISFSGSYTVDNPDLSLATKFNSFSSVEVELGPTGSYAGTAGAVVTMTPFTFDPFGGPVLPQWTFTSGATTYSFDLTFVSVAFESATALVLEGSGLAHISGGVYESTPGLWNLSANTLGSTFSFSSGTATVGTAETRTAVPDTGASASLLGLSLVAMGVLSRYARSLRA